MMELVQSSRHHKEKSSNILLFSDKEYKANNIYMLLNGSKCTWTITFMGYKIQLHDVNLFG